MKKLGIGLEKKIETIRVEAVNEFINENFDECIELLLDSWNLLPSPKVIYSQSFHIVKYLIETFRKKGEYQKTIYWQKMLFLCDLERADFGEREFLCAEIALETNNIEDAKYFFWIAFEKSNGRIFKEEDKKYYNFYLEEIKGKYPF